MAAWFASIKISRILAVKFIRVVISSIISIILPVFLLEEGYDVGFVGIIVSITLLSNIPFNIIVMLFIRRWKERKVLTILALLMAVSPLLFAWNISPAIVVLGAIIGLVSANGTETGPFQSIDQAIISAKAGDTNRTNLFSVYNFVGYAGMSLGSLFSGLPDFLATVGFGIQNMFFIYAALALLQGIIYFSMRELDAMPKDNRGFHFNPATKPVVTKLSLLFAMDAFGGGFVVRVLLTTWFLFKYNTPLGALSVLFAIADVITAFSIFLAPIIAKRIGLLNTMIWTHLPSNVFLILVPFAPDLILAATWLFLRQSISQMDVPTRQSYTNAIIAKEDRASTAAITNTSRTVAQSLSPPLTTAFIDAGALTLPFVFGGGIKIIYDVAIYLSFRHIKPPEELKR